MILKKIFPDGVNSDMIGEFGKLSIVNLLRAE